MAIRKRKSKQPEGLYLISSLAADLCISTRTIRFYEEKGLIAPERSQGNQRIYNKTDRTRLKLILRGKRFGLSLEEIQDILGTTDSRTDEKVQILRAQKYGDRLLLKIQERIEELRQMEVELLELNSKCQQRLNELS